MSITLSVDGEALRRAERRAEAMGTTVNQLLREYIEQLAGITDPAREAAEFELLSRVFLQDSQRHDRWPFIFRAIARSYPCNSAG